MLARGRPNLSNFMEWVGVLQLSLPISILCDSFNDVLIYGRGLCCTGPQGGSVTGLMAMFVAFSAS